MHKGFLFILSIATLTLSIALSASAESSDTPARRACNPARAKELASLEKRVSDLLTRVESAASPALSSDVQDVYRGVIDRARVRLTKADHMHGRCWHEDKLSCSLLRAALEEVANTEALSTATTDLRTLRVEVSDTAASLGERCGTLRWNLG
jgi:hypothetical protein